MDTKTFLDNFGHIVYAPNGIQKMKEFILTLAMQGELVPQSSTEQDAGELLEETEVIKQKLIKQRKIKETKALPEIKPEEIPHVLPSTWQWVRFGNIAQHNAGKTLDKGRNTGRLRDYITTSNLYWGHFVFNDVRQMPINDEEIEKCSARKGDLLICEGGEAGRAAVWSYDKEVCFQNHVHRARFYHGIDPYFAYRFFEKLNATGEINQHRKGVAISNMSGKALASILFPLPPLEEQKRIVAKVDQLMALCDQIETQQKQKAKTRVALNNAALDKLLTAQNPDEFNHHWQRMADNFHYLYDDLENITMFRSAVIGLATKGKLVQQVQNDEPASKELQRINKNLCKLIGKSNLPILKRDESIVDPAVYHFPIPESWEWCELQDISLFLNGKAHEQFVTEDQKFVLVNSRFVSNSGEIIKYASSRLTPLSKGDIAIVMSDVPNGRALARCFIIDEDDKYTLNQRIGGILSTSDIDCRYLAMVLDRNKYYLQYDDGQKQTNLKKIQVLSCPIPLPPLEEQKRIVAKVDQLMVLCEQLEIKLKQSHVTSEKLIESVVHNIAAA